jgi:hypothetical protein
MNASKTGKHQLADIFETSAIVIHQSVERALRWEQPITHVEECRAEIISANDYCRRQLMDLLEAEKKPEIAPAIRTRKANQKLFAFIGNFRADESTENMIKWALEEGLGHEIIELQENEINLAAIKSACVGADALIWVRTPGWLAVTDREMFGLLEGLKIPSLSIHLDKFWGIPEREELIGHIPFWKTEHVFTADGSADDRFAARGVNHHWMRPAVSEIYCHPGRPWDMYRCDVGFVGAKDYHAEYPFRRQLVEWLERTYEGRFKHITNVRGHALNDFYASCKVVVGDCIFAGTPCYWSDRLPETCGRHGFLLHPQIDGLGFHPVATYAPQDLSDLHEQLERWLEDENDRREVRENSYDYVRRFDTWTTRMREILEVAL